MFAGTRAEEVAFATRVRPPEAGREQWRQVVVRQNDVDKAIERGDIFPNRHETFPRAGFITIPYFHATRANVPIEFDPAHPNQRQVPGSQPSWAWTDWLMIGLGVAVVGGGGFYFWKRRR